MDQDQRALYDHLQDQFSEYGPQFETMVRYMLATIGVMKGVLREKSVGCDEEGRRYLVFEDLEDGEEYVVEDPNLTEEKRAQLLRECRALAAEDANA